MDLWIHLDSAVQSRLLCIGWLSLHTSTSLCCVYYVVFLRLNCSADANLHGFIWIHLYESLRWNSRVVVSVWCVYIPNARCAHGPPLLLHTLPSGSDSKNICSHN